VRRRDNITGFGSGCGVAAKEFSLSIVDAVSGVVTQPYRGARKEGVVGFGKGIGKGIGGLVIKSGAAVFAIPGYTLKGLERGVEKRYDRDLKAQILAVRIRQGLGEFGKAGEEEKEEVVRRFREVQRCDGRRGSVA